MRRLAVLALIGLSGGWVFGQVPPAEVELLREFLDGLRQAGEQEQRADEGHAEARVDPANPQASLARVLRTRIAEIRLDNAPLGIALETVAEAVGINLVVRWNVLEAAGVERDTAIRLRVRNLPLETILWLILQEAAPIDLELAYRFGPDLILISTAEDFGSQMMVRVYDVAELVFPRSDQATLFIGETRDYVRSVEPYVGGSVGMPRPIIGRYEGGIYQGIYGAWMTDGITPREHEQRMRELIHLITTTVAPESWAVNGGSGTIVPFRDRLVVRNSPLVHQQIGRPLKKPDE